MNRSVRVLAGLTILAIMMMAAGCTKLQARDQLNKGVQSYKNARYEEAISHFKRAVELDSKLLNARLYLATAYAQQYIPGADTEDNNRMANSAIEEYKNVLQADPNNVGSVKGIAYLYLQMKKFDQAKEYYKKAAAIDPKDPETYYSVAVIDWTEAYQPRMEERAKLGLKPTEPLKDKKVCEALKTKSEASVEDGINMLNQALKLRPDYDDAMAYMNLLYRERADYNCASDESNADLKTADEWVDKTMATKKAKAEKAGQSGIVIDQKQ
jgi:tetratricopeptide (TPR) repeat protein